MIEYVQRALPSSYADLFDLWRAVRVGRRTLVSGTQSVEKDGMSKPGDFYEQAKWNLGAICEAVEAPGGCKREDTFSRIAYGSDRVEESCGRFSIQTLNWRL